MEQVTVKIKGITYSDKETGFCILKSIDTSSGKLITVKGNFPGVHMNVGLKVKFEGDWVEHEKFGVQFGAHQCQIIAEKGQNGATQYLISHVPSIGPITASKLYVHFGDNLIDVLNNTPEKILEVDFLTKKQAESILDEWKQSSIMRTVAIILTDLGLNSSQIKSVYKKWGVETKKILKEDPYRLCECDGVGFMTADIAARRLGIGPNDDKRTKAIILFIMRELSSSDGHMYVLSDEIRSVSEKLFKRHNLEPYDHGHYLADIHFYRCLSQLIESGHVISLKDKLYLKRNWDNETRAAQHISDMIQHKPRGFNDLEISLTEFEQKRGATLSPEQREAYFLLAKSNVITVSGFPGTGKTFLTSAFVHLFERNHIDYTLMSPTGIAAKRASQVTGKPASTIHRALGYKVTGEWEFNKNNKYRVDAVIVDEMSMVDASTFYNLISALPSSTILIMIGDSAQLPSVGAGYVLKNLMESEVPHVALTRIYRQMKQSEIVQVAHQILSGLPVDLSFNKDSEFLFFNYHKDNVVDEICKITTVMKNKEANFQVIAPMYDGVLGVNNLNKELRNVLNTDYIDGKSSKIKHGTTDLHEGDRVMVIKNDYDKMVYNGDVGKVQKISIKDDEVEIKIFNWFDTESTVPRYIDKVFTYTVEEVKKNLRVAYACTAHKVQGQEFDYVLLPMTMQYGIMLYRNLIYTAITRAKKKVFIFGDTNAFNFAIENDREISRNSLLSSMIGWYYREDEKFLNHLDMVEEKKTGLAKVS